MKIHIYHATAGHGHKQVAEVLAKVFYSRGLSREEVRVQDSLDFTSPCFRRLYLQSYYRMVRHNPGFWGLCYETSDKPWFYRMMRPFRQAINSCEGRKLLKRVIEDDPDHIICTHFFSADVLSRAKKAGKIRAVITTVITDFYPHSFWINPGTDYYWVMNEESRADLIKRGVVDEKILVGGIPADPVFKPSGRKKENLKKWGFEANRFTILLTSGSFGLGPQEAMLKALNEFGEMIQCFVVCGNNEKLKAKLSSAQYAYPTQIFGFVDCMPDLMEASDLLIAKSGGATTVESLMKDLPMIVIHPIPGQEMRNADFLKRHNASFFIQEPEQVKLIVQNVLANQELLKSKHRAIREIAKPNAAEDLVSFILKGAFN